MKGGKMEADPQLCGTSSLFAEIALTSLLSQDALQAAAIYGISKANASSSLKKSGSWGTEVLGYYWDYSLSLGTPGVALAGLDLDLTLPVNISVKGVGIVRGQHIGLNYKASVQPTPRAVFSIATDGNKVQITFKSINTGRILLEPMGNVAEQIAGWVLAGIANAINASFSIVLTTFVKKISFPSVVPPFSWEGFKVTITPSNLTLSNQNGMLAIGGTLTVRRVVT
jgi:hypothetical protein